MKSTIKKNLTIAGLFVALGLLITFQMFFLLFGNGLQFIAPWILTAVFFTFLLIINLLPFIKSNNILKIILFIVFVCIVVFIY